MNSYAFMRVDLPEGIYKQKRKNGYAIYQYTRHYRNKDGKPRHEAKFIGILDESVNKLIPNQNYFTVNNISEPINISKPEIYFNQVLNYGYTFAVFELCKKVGLIDILKDVFSDSYADILSIASYMVYNDAAMDYIDDWLDHTYYYSESIIDGRFCSSLFSNINKKLMDNFFSRWIDLFDDKSSYFYDVTSISSYSDLILTVERGYNRDHDKLGQINIGMFCHKETKLPVYYNVYNGSLTDKINLKYVLANANDCGLGNINLILDGGFFDKTRIDDLDNSGYKYIVGMPGYLDVSKKIIREYKEGINEFKYKLKKHTEYCKSVDYKIFGKTKRVLLCFNESLRNDMMSGTVDKLKRLEDEIKTKKRFSAVNKSRYTKYFKITELDDGGFNYEEDENKMMEITQTYGYFLIVGNDYEIDKEDMLYYYRSKDADEKLFMAIKNYMDGKRMRTHNDQTTNGKIFVLFIALIIRSLLFNHLEEYLNKQNITLKKALHKLNDIQIVQTNSDNRLLKAITKQQRDLLDELKIKTKIEDSIQSI